MSGPGAQGPEPADTAGKYAEPEATEPDASEPDATEPDATERAERARRADRATKGGLAGLLCLEAFVVLLVPRAIAQTATGLSDTKTFLLLGLAIVLIACGFLLRRPWGIGLGSALQLLVAATAILIPVILIVVLFFVFLWWFLLRTRQQLVGTPSGWRMLVS